MYKVYKIMASKMGVDTSCDWAGIEHYNNCCLQMLAKTTHVQCGLSLPVVTHGHAHHAAPAAVRLHPWSELLHSDSINSRMSPGKFISLKNLLGINNPNRQHSMDV